MADNVIRTISFRGTSEGLDELTNKLREVAAEEKNIALVSDDLSKRQISLASAWKQTGVRLDEMARNLDNFARLMKQNNQLLEQGGITAEQHGQRVAQLTVRYDSAAVSIRKFTEEQTKMGQAANQAIQQAAKTADAAQKRGAELAAINTSGAINQRLNVRDDFGVAQRAKDFETAAKAADDLRAKYSPLFAAQREYKARLDEIREGVKTTALTEKEGAAAIQTTKAAFAEHVNTLKGVAPAASNASKEMAALTKQSSRNAAEMLNLGRQFADVGVSLQAGQSILVVGLQQGAQIIDVIASSNRSMSQIASQAIGWAKGLVTSLGGVVTAVAAAVAAVGYLVQSYASAQKEIDKVLTSGPGAASGLARSSLNQIAQGAVGSGMNVNEARAAALEFAKTGQIYEQNIKSATEATRLFVQAAGIDAADASKQLAAALVDPSKGAQDLNKQFGFLDATLLNHIRTLQSQGKLQEAQAALLAGLTPRLKQQAETVDFMTAAWRKADQAVIDFNKSIDKALGLAPKDLTTQLDEAMKKLQAAQDAVAKAGDFGVGPRGMKALQDAAAAAEAEVRRLEKAMADLKAQAEAQRLKDLSNIADAFTRALIPSIEQVEKLTTAISYLEKAKAAGVGGPNIDAALAVANMQLAIAKETVDVERRKAEVFNQNAQRYSNVSALTAQTLAAMKDQLNVASAVGVSAQIEAQRRATINQLLREGKSLNDAIAVADAQRAISLAQIESQHQVTMVSLQGQLAVAQERTGLGQINAQYEADINNKLMQGLNLSQAIAQATMQREIALAQVNAEADRQLKTLQQEGELISANTDREKAAIAARHTYNDLIEKGVSAGKAREVADQKHSNALREIEKQEQRAADAIGRQYEGVKTAAEAWDMYREGLISWSLAADKAGELTQRLAAASEDAAYWANQAASSIFSAGQAALIANTAFVPFATAWKSLGPSGLGTGGAFQGPQGLTQFKPGGYESSGGTGSIITNMMTAAYGSGGFDPMTGAPNAQGLMFKFNEDFNRALTASAGNLGAAVGGIIGKGGVFTGTEADPQRLALLERAINLMPKEQQISSYQGLMGQLGAAPQNLQTAELTKQLGDKLTELTRATDENTSATSAMTDVLSPFYSSDPRRTHLGFRAFAGGGIMTSHGELPLRHYQGGGMATSPQVAVFGEGSTPEAYVPVPSGRIPVELKAPANSNQRPVNVTINVMGNADAGTVAALKQTSFQKAQQLRKMTG